MGSAPGHLNSHNLPHELFLVQIVARVLSIAPVVELDESKFVLDGNVFDLAIFSEEMFDVTVSASVSNASKVNTPCHL